MNHEVQQLRDENRRLEAANIEMRRALIHIDTLAPREAPPIDQRYESGQYRLAEIVRPILKRVLAS